MSAELIDRLRALADYAAGAPAVIEKDSQLYRDMIALLREAASSLALAERGDGPKPKRQRCNAGGPKPYQTCGRWKGHEGEHREMNHDTGWTGEYATAVAEAPSGAQE